MTQMSPCSPVAVVAAACLALSGIATIEAPLDAPRVGVPVEHVVLARLPQEHVANAVYRRAANGQPMITAWGDRVLEWALEPGAAMRVVVPAEGDWEYTNGGTALDLDGDGADEIVTGRGHGRQRSRPELVWLEDVADETRHRVHVMATLDVGNFVAPHDIQPYEARVGAPRVRGVVYNVGRRQLFFAEMPADPRQPWTIHEIGRFPEPNQSGLTMADIDGDGRTDLVSGQYWVEAPDADPGSGAWRFHRFSTWPASRWAGMNTHAVADLDGDGRDEIVVAEAEIADARVAVFSRGDDPTRPWREELVADDLYCPHSLQVHDVDGDGRRDLLIGEMTAGGWDFPMHDRPAIWAFMNRGDLRFDRRVLARGEGVHEMKIAPIRIDGRAVLFAADEVQLQKFPDMRTHVGFWLIGEAR